MWPPWINIIIILKFTSVRDVVSYIILYYIIIIIIITSETGNNIYNY